MKHINRVVGTIMIVLGMALAIFSCGLLTIQTAESAHSIMEPATGVQTPIPFEQVLSMQTGIEGCGINTDSTSIASAFRLLMAGTISPYAFKHHVYEYYQRNPIPGLTTEQIDGISNQLLENCYGKRQGI